MSLSNDVQYSLRTMRKSPRITITVLATLVLGIGANTAIFSVVNATLLKPLPFHNPGELVELNADLRRLGAHNVGLLLSCVGVYGIASYSVVRREKEIGIRSALGASRNRLVFMTLRDGMVPVLVGMTCGCIAAVFSGRMLAALLFDVNSADGMVFACAGFTLAAIGMLANYIPARRAGRIEPVTALRN